MRLVVLCVVQIDSRLFLLVVDFAFGFYRIAFHFHLSFFDSWNCFHLETNSHVLSLNTFIHTSFYGNVMFRKETRKTKMTTMKRRKEMSKVFDWGLRKDDTNVLLLLSIWAKRRKHEMRKGENGKYIMTTIDVNRFTVT